MESVDTRWVHFLFIGNSVARASAWVFGPNFKLFSKIIDFSRIFWYEMKALMKRSHLSLVSLVSSPVFYSILIKEICLHPSTLNQIKRFLFTFYIFIFNIRLFDHSKYKSSPRVLRNFYHEELWLPLTLVGSWNVCQNRNDLFF